jgi:hypothetical protein
MLPGVVSAIATATLIMPLFSPLNHDKHYADIDFLSATP